jgi:dephospho-CoA kinase
LTIQTIGLTGGIGCGKSTVARILAKKGFYVVSADELARQTIEPGGAAYQDVVNRFGNEILKDDGQIDRLKLGMVVFSDKTARKDLESFIHPKVLIEISQLITQSRERGLKNFVVETPLLFEVNWEYLFEKIWVVSCLPEIQLKRIQERDQLSQEKARQRIAAQLPLSYKEAKADAVIYNNQGYSDLEAQIEQMIKSLE